MNLEMMDWKIINQIIISMETKHKTIVHQEIDSISNVHQEIIDLGGRSRGAVQSGADSFYS